MRLSRFLCIVRDARQSRRMHIFSQRLTAPGPSHVPLHLPRSCRKVGYYCGYVIRKNCLGMRRSGRTGIGLTTVRPEPLSHRVLRSCWTCSSKGRSQMRLNETRTTTTTMCARWRRMPMAVDRTRFVHFPRECSRLDGAKTRNNKTHAGTHIHKHIHTHTYKSHVLQRGKNGTSLSTFTCCPVGRGRSTRADAIVGRTDAHAFPPWRRRYRPPLSSGGGRTKRTRPEEPLAAAPPVFACSYRTTFVTSSEKRLRSGPYGGHVR